MATRFAVSVTLVLLVFSIHSSFAADTPAAPPATVAIMPVVNLTTRSWDELKAKQSQRAVDEMTSRFDGHGYKVLGAAAVAAAEDAQKVDYADQSNWTAVRLAQVGIAAHADFVAFLVITDTHQGWRHGMLLLAPQREGEAKTTFFLVDVRSGAAIVDGVKESGKARESELSGFITDGYGEGSSKYTLGAVADAVDKSLKLFFALGPQANPVSAAVASNTRS